MYEHLPRSLRSLMCYVQVHTLSILSIYPDKPIRLAVQNSRALLLTGLTGSDPSSAFGGPHLKKLLHYHISMRRWSRGTNASTHSTELWCTKGVERSFVLLGPKLFVPVTNTVCSSTIFYARARSSSCSSTKCLCSSTI